MDTTFFLRTPYVLSCPFIEAPHVRTSFLLCYYITRYGGRRKHHGLITPVNVDLSAALAKFGKHNSLKRRRHETLKETKGRCSGLISFIKTAGKFKLNRQVIMVEAKCRFGIINQTFCKAIPGTNMRIEYPSFSQRSLNTPVKIEQQGIPEDKIFCNRIGDIFYPDAEILQEATCR